MKRCPRCQTDKPLDAFHLQSLRKDGRQVYCKACQADYDRDRACRAKYVRKRKHCNGCGELQAVSAFHKRRQSNDGLASQCKTCTSAYAKLRKPLPLTKPQRSSYLDPTRDAHA